MPFVMVFTTVVAPPALVPVCVKTDVDTMVCVDDGASDVVDVVTTELEVVVNVLVLVDDNDDVDDDVVEVVVSVDEDADADAALELILSRDGIDEIDGKKWTYW